MEDEATRLAAQNSQLRLELEDLKRRVEVLRELRFSHEEKAVEDSHENQLLLLENDLLRAQLREQQAFLEGCRLLATPSLPQSSIASQRELMQQGAENALTQLFLMVSQCQIASDFQPMKLPEHCFQSAVPGLTVTCCIRKQLRDPQTGISTIAMRVDGCFPNIPPETVARGYWATWTNAEAYAETFKGFFDKKPALAPAQLPRVKQESEEGEDRVVGKTPMPFVIKELLSERNEEEDRETVVNLYREFPEDKEPCDWIYCQTKVKREIALSTLSMAAELNPGVATRRDQHTRRVLPPSTGNARVRKRAKGSSSASQLMGRQECIVLARNTMRGIEAPPSTPKSRSVLDVRERRTVEGLYVWQDEVHIDSQIECEEGREILRQRVPATRASAFISFSSDVTFVQETNLLAAIVDAQGKATERFSKLIDSYYARLGKRDGEAAATM